MTSVRTYYCKKEGSVSRKKDNVIKEHNENRYPTTIVSKKPIIKNETCGNGVESSGRARNVTDKKMPNTNRSMEAQSSNPILSPETSTALENAEKIMNNAKIQLMEVCATSNLDSARQNRNTYSNDLPLDDEAEELLYIRELVASKFHEASSSRSEADGKAASLRSEERPRVTVRRVDLSAPKFRMSQRRRADWTSLGYGSDDQSRGRASPAVGPSRDDSSSKDGNEAMMRVDERRRASSASEREPVCARENACGIQIGPSVHIVDRELTRQNLDDVHISPDPSWTRCRGANTATYVLSHGVTESATSTNNEPEMSRAPRTICGRLDTLQPGELERPNVAETAVEDAARVGNSDSGRDERIESAKSRVQDYTRGEERKDRESDPRHVGDTRISEQSVEGATNQGAIDSAVIKNSGTGNGTLRSVPKDGNQVKIGFRDDTDDRYAKDRARLENEHTADKIQDDRSNRSKRPPADDASKKTGFPRRENVTPRHRATESSRSYRTINERFSSTFNSHNGQDGLRDNAAEDVHRSFTSSSDDFRAEENDDSNEIDLYRPRLDDLDSILLSNDKKLERVSRVTKNFAQLLSKPEFLKCKLDEDREIPRHVDRKEFRQKSSVDKNKHEPARSSTLEIELRNEDLIVSTVGSEIHRTNANSHGQSAKSSGSPTENEYRSEYSKNSVESSAFSASDTSDVSGTSSNSDKARPPMTHLSESLMDKSDVTTLSNVFPALSSTRTDSCRHREERITPGDRHADAKPRGTRTNSRPAANKLATRESDPDDVLARILRDPREDASETADRFVAYILQDEKRSIEGKVASALKESAIAPTAVRMFLDHLREAESIRNARQAETLDILKSIFVNINQTDQGANKNKKNDEKTVEKEGTDGLIPREENVQQTQAEINAIEQVEKNSHLKRPDEHSSDFSERRETKEGILSAGRFESVQNSKDDSKSKRNARRTESVDIPKDILVNITNHAGKSVNDEDVKNDDEDVADFLIGTNAPSNAIQEPILQKEAKDNVSDIGQIAKKSRDPENPDKYLPDTSAFRETRENVRSGSAQGSKNNSKGNSYSEAESLKQVSDIRSDDDKSPDKILRHSPIKTASVKSNEGRKMGADDANVTIAISENKRDNAQSNKNDARSDVPREAVKEITIEGAHNNITANENTSPVTSRILEIKDERVRSDASSAAPKFAGEAQTKESSFVLSANGKENIASLQATGKDLVTKKKINPENSRSADSPRSASLSSAKNGKSLKEVASHGKRTSFNIAEDDSTKYAKSDEIRSSSTTAVENRRDETENSGLLKSAKSNEQQPNTLQKRRIDILSDSNSSVNSTLLDYDDRSTNDAFSLNTKRIGTSSETSHSEGELYMPSSCSYSLGEVRVLKRDLIEDDTIDRDSSVTVLVTRSIMTSLNDSTVSLLGSSEH